MIRKLPFFIIGMVVILHSCENASNSDASENKMETEESTINYLALGKNYALKTKSELGKNLTNALGEGGAEHALSFCNTRAIPLTDGMSMELKAEIKRVSDRPRNVNNSANADELAFINHLKSRMEKGEKPGPKMTELNGKMVGYYPILTNGMCLQCHGKPNSDISVGTQQKIKSLYPTDLATGYGDNQIRGLFVVEMDKQ